MSDIGVFVVLELLLDAVYFLFNTGVEFGNGFFGGRVLRDFRLSSFLVCRHREDGYIEMGSNRVYYQ